LLEFLMLKNNLFDVQLWKD